MKWNLNPVSHILVRQAIPNRYLEIHQITLHFLFEEMSLDVIGYR